MGTRSYDFVAETDVWTGDINQSGDRLITTGLLGSIRWWFEAVVFALGGKACDPTRNQCNNDVHSDDRGHYGHNRCVVCETFGCTGWGRKFFFDVLSIRAEGEELVRKTDQIRRDESIRLQFTPTRGMREEEWAILDLTLRVISDRGAVGGIPGRKGEKRRVRAERGRITLKAQSPKAIYNIESVREYVRTWTDPRGLKGEIGNRKAMYEKAKEWLLERQLMLSSVSEG